MAAKAARVKKIPFTCEITDPPEQQINQNIYNPVSGLVNILRNVFIKDAHRFKDSNACPETSVRVCFCLGG